MNEALCADMTEEEIKKRLSSILDNIKHPDPMVFQLVSFIRIGTPSKMKLLAACNVFSELG
jgi:hypothetical protein